MNCAKRDVKYYLNQDGEFVIENYNQSKPFSSFLPAVAGLYGKPMWAYYVNRGQCMATFGINNKDYSIMEFQPANKAYRQTSTQGFRTFLKIREDGSGSAACYEPFQDLNHNRDKDILQKIYITSYDLRLEEINKTLGIKVEVMFCTLPNESLSSLVRKVVITNISGRPLEIELVDGLPAIIPYFIINKDMKNESNLRQAWMGVENYNTIPFYKLKVLPYDTAETVFIEGGNFYLNFDFNQERKLNISRTIVEPGLIFGNVTDLTYPEGFYNDEFNIPEEQVNVGITPCGFGYKRLSLDPGGCDTGYSLIGSAGNYDGLLEFVNQKLGKDYMEDKIEENKRIVESLKGHIFTSSSSREFDLYCGQSFMDNFLRGGYPVQLGNGKHVFYVYSRKHGDLEREYNFFQVDSTYYSQGNSNFRDVNQNRRNDVSFFPFTGDTNIKTFFNLIQLDGFNPLVVKGSVFNIGSLDNAEAVVTEYLEGGNFDEVIEHLRKPFTPGSLLDVMEGAKVGFKKGNADEFVNRILEQAEKSDMADFHEGYWVDHWTYNTDFIEQFLAIFPDKAEELLFKDEDYTYYDNYEIVVPRDNKYVLTGIGVRQLGSVVKVEEKEKLIKERSFEPFKVRTEHGKGEIYKCSLISKITTLLVNKIASLDPAGVGIEMESNKPGWCDALNGLPAILGSSINESAEVKRLALIVLDILNSNRMGEETKVKVPEEVFKFFNKVYTTLVADIKDFEYWNLTTRAKEEYRDAVVFGISGIEKEIDAKQLKAFLERVSAKVDKGLEKAFNAQDGLHYTYFINEVVQYEVIIGSDGEPVKNKNGYTCVTPLKFKQRPIPYFLEGPVHVLRTESHVENARNIYDAIKKTGLYDEKLKMYKVNDNIMDETKEIGRQNVFPRGWLENEAVFLHMEYKYLMELLRCGLYEEYFMEMKNCLIPFLSPEMYGRSTLENSSFIASSAHPDSKIHGTGFVSRLTGASAELLNMWLLMGAGKRPFYLDYKGELCLKLEPVLPGWMFTNEERRVQIFKGMAPEELTLPANSFTFTFLGKVLVVYHNEGRKDTFGDDGAEIKKYSIYKKDGSGDIVEGSIIPAPLAGQIRDGLVDRIDVVMG